MSTAIENEEFWKQQLEKLKASGLTRSQYCRNNGLNYHRFGYWIQRLLSSSTFIPVKVSQPEVMMPIPNITLCTLEMRNYIIKIHDLSALSFLLERLA